VLIVHDCADHLLELAKLCKYIKYKVGTYGKVVFIEV
jgi:hypothetical protein